MSDSNANPPRKILSLKRKTAEQPSEVTQEQTPSIPEIITTPEVYLEPSAEVIEPTESVAQPELSKEERQQIKRARIQEIWGIFEEHFPAVFNPNDRKPFTVGIHHAMTKALADRGITIKTVWLKEAMYKWVSRRDYFKAALNSEHRYHLDGSPAELMTDEDRKFFQLKMCKKRVKPKRQPKVSSVEPNQEQVPTEN